MEPVRAAFQKCKICGREFAPCPPYTAELLCFFCAPREDIKVRLSRSYPVTRLAHSTPTEQAQGQGLGCDSSHPALSPHYDPGVGSEALDGPTADREPSSAYPVVPLQTGHVIPGGVE